MKLKGLIIALCALLICLVSLPAMAGPNLALSKPIVCNNYTQTYVATNANDGNTGTYWEGAPNSYPNTLTVDLQSSQTIDNVVIKLNPNAIWGTRTQTLSVLGSTDNVNFSTLKSSATYTFNPSTGNMVTITFTSTSRRWVRLSFTANSGATAGQVAEFEVSLNGSVTPTPTTTPVSGTVDLVVTDITWSPANPAVGSEVTFSATIRNQGTGTSPSGVIHGIAFLVDGTLVSWSDNNTTALGPGASRTQAANWGPNSKATWTATSGTHTIRAWVDDVNRMAESNEGNNTFDKSLGIGVPTPTATLSPTPTKTPTPSPLPTPSPIPSPTPGSRGASVPYTRFEADAGSYGGGAVLRTAPTFDYTLIAAQASDQRYVELPSNGSYVQWTVNRSGAGITMRFTMPDTGDGMGQNGSLDCYVNGSKVATISLSSYWMWQYFAIGSDQPQDAPNGGRAAFAFDEVHWKLPTALKSGDTIKIQSTGGLVYGVDFIEVETVPGVVGQPANALSVTSYGATANDGTDDMAAFNSCVSAAVSQGKSVYIPSGTFNLGSMWVIGSVGSPIANLTITGAGMWHTNIQFTNPNSSGGGISLRMTATGTLDFSNMWINSKLRSRYNQNAIYKCFMDNFGANSRIHDIWEEHFECGFWVGDYAHTPAWAAQNLQISNSRIRNNLADGVNFCQGTSNSIVTNCSVRNNGDDGLAMWPDSTMGAPMEVNNRFTYNTIENNWRAAGIGIFGGSGHSATNNYIKDCFMGSGVRLNTVFPGYHFENNTGITISHTTIVNSGTSHDCYNGEAGAIELMAANGPLNNITFDTIDIINTQRDAIQMGYGGGFTNMNFNNININGTGKDNTTTSRFSQPHGGAAIFVYTGNGSATFRNLVTSNVEGPNLIQSGFVINFQ